MAAQHQQDSTTDNIKMSNTIKRWLMRIRRRLHLTGGSLGDSHQDAGAPTELYLMTSYGASCSTLVSWLEIDDNTRNEQLESKMAASAL